ncbi:MAG: hypothetical protein H0U74_13915 [Bradymonadaceae bacterium]|nr:hypothetical protein [Lujinxingiaceae bacterium]
MDLIDLIDSRRFLGSEFLMWLWFKSECFDGLFELGEEKKKLEVVLDDAMTLEAYLAETERNTFKGGAPAYSPEAKVALRQGKRLAKAKMRIIEEGREWVFNIKSETLDLSSINIPAVLSREEDEKFFERMFLVEEIENIVAALYAEFLGIRLTSAWPDAMLPAMQAWIASDEPAAPNTYPSGATQLAAATIALKKDKPVAVPVSA